MAHDEQWLTPRLQTAATLCNQTPAATESPLWLGVDHLTQCFPINQNKMQLQLW